LLVDCFVFCVVVVVSGVFFCAMNLTALFNHHIFFIQCHVYNVVVVVSAIAIVVVIVVNASLKVVEK